MTYPQLFQPASRPVRLDVFLEGRAFEEGVQREFSWKGAGANDSTADTQGEPGTRMCPHLVSSHRCTSGHNPQSHGASH